MLATDALPVNPPQILMTCKRLLDRQRIRGQHVSKDYLQSFGQISSRLGGQLSPDDWIELYTQLVNYERELDEDEGLRQVLADQFREANSAFGRYVEQNYAEWVSSPGKSETRPVLSHEVVPTADHYGILLRDVTVKHVSKLLGGWYP